MSRNDDSTNLQGLTEVDTLLKGLRQYYIWPSYQFGMTTVRSSSLLVAGRKCGYWHKWVFSRSDMQVIQKVDENTESFKRSNSTPWVTRMNTMCVLVGLARARSGTRFV